MNHASHTRSQGCGKHQRMRGIYGVIVSNPFAFFDPSSHSLKMSEGFLLVSLDDSFPDASQTWPTSGMMRSGVLSAQRVKGHRTGERESGLYLTPTKVHAIRTDEGVDAKEKYRQSIGRTTTPPGSLSEQIARGCSAEDMRKPMWPTPDKNDGARGPRSMDNLMTKNHQITLTTAARHGIGLDEINEKKKSYPTPQSNTTTGDQHGKPSLTKTVKKQWATPTKRDYKDTGNPEKLTGCMDRGFTSLTAEAVVENNKKDLTFEPHKLILIYVKLFMEIHNGQTYATKTEEVLSLLRNAINSKGMEWANGMHGGIQEKEILQSYLSSIEKESFTQNNIFEKSLPIQEDELRSMWEHYKSVCASHRPGLQEQFTREYSDSLQTLSRLLAFDCQEGKTIGWTYNSREDAKPTEGLGLNPSWCEWLMAYPKGWTDIDCDNPEPFEGWDVDPADELPSKKYQTPVKYDSTPGGPNNHYKGLGNDGRHGRLDAGTCKTPRLTSIKKNRANRIMALGNSIVPKVATFVLRKVKAYFEDREVRCE